jgi:hypothetical protein
MAKAFVGVAETAAMLFDLKKTASCHSEIY